MRELALFVSGLLFLVSPAWAAPAPAGKTEVTWLGHAAWIVKTPGGATLALDPWLKNPKAPAEREPPAALDAVLVSHGHFDHVGEAAELAKKTGAPVVGSYELVGSLALPEAQAMGANAGGSVRIKDVTITLTDAVHSSSLGGPGKAPQYAGAPVGFVLAIDKGPTLYHAGDTDAFSSMQLIQSRYHPTAAMLPIGGHFTMDPAGAALAAKLLGVKKVFPMHFGTFPVLAGTPDELRKKVGSGVTVVDLQPGGSATL